MKLRVNIHRSWTAVDGPAWDALVGPRSPFLEHAFLCALEQSGCAGPRQGWHPLPITVWRGDDLVAGAPAWLVDHAQGQYVYQEHWREALGHHGRRLEPKVVVGIPLTPVTGARLLIADPPDPKALHALLDAIRDIAQPYLAWHLFFPLGADVRASADRGAFARSQYQYHWHNHNYHSFDDYLAALRRRRRKEVRRERRALADLHFAHHAAPSDQLIAHAWVCYANTAARYETEPLVNRAFFEQLAATWRHRLWMVVGSQGRDPIGAALFVQKGDRLYGRYAGRLIERDFLHFELCYYQGIEHCIAHDLRAFEPGHGGEHKFARGFDPVLTHSAHRFRHRVIHEAFRDHAVRERAFVGQRIQELHEGSALRPPRPDPLAADQSDRGGASG